MSFRVGPFFTAATYEYRQLLLGQRGTRQAQQQHGQGDRQHHVDAGENHKANIKPWSGRHRILCAQEVIDDPRLSSQFGDHPAKFYRNEGERTGQDDPPEQQAILRNNTLAPEVEQPEYAPDEQREEATADHTIKGGMDKE